MFTMFTYDKSVGVEKRENKSKSKYINVNIQKRGIGTKFHVFTAMHEYMKL